MQIEDLYRAAKEAGMLTPVVFQGETVYCAFRGPDVSVLDGLALSSGYHIDYPASQLDLAQGDQVEIEGKTYRVREVRALRDGSECRAALSLL